MQHRALGRSDRPFGPELFPSALGSGPNLQRLAIEANGRDHAGADEAAAQHHRLVEVRAVSGEATEDGDIRGEFLSQALHQRRAIAAGAVGEHQHRPKIRGAEGRADLATHLVGVVGRGHSTRRHLDPRVLEAHRRDRHSVIGEIGTDELARGRTAGDRSLRVLCLQSIGQTARAQLFTRAEDQHEVGGRVAHLGILFEIRPETCFDSHRAHLPTFVSPYNRSSNR